MLPSGMQELTQYKNWVVSTADKIPWRCDGKGHASSTNPDDWSTFEETAALCAKHPHLTPGFVLTNSPFAVIDLDATDDPDTLKIHAEIFAQFSSCTEVSMSGKGAHIWLKGSIPEGAKFPERKVEIYSSDRYIKITGNIVNDAPIQDRQELLNALYTEIRSKQSNTTTPEQLIDSEQVNSDQEIINKAKQAANGDLFSKLWAGDYLQEYSSQSEADLALVDILAFYTDNQKQVKRMFLASALGKRDKATKRKNYVDNMVKKSFDRKVPSANQYLKDAMEKHKPTKVKQAEVEEVVEESEPIHVWAKPTGLLGEITQFIYQASLYPTQEVALAGAIAMMAGMCGRAYNVNGTGLNQYLVLLADTGSGKEAAASGISKLGKAIRFQLPAFDKFIGPSEIASPQALLKFLGKESNSFWSHKGEIGFWFQKLNDKYAKANESSLKAMLLDVYHKSGNSQVLQGSIYSDNTKNAPVVYAPAVTIFGDSTPQEFYKSLDERSIMDGLVSRFTVIQCNEVRPVYNPAGAKLDPDPALVWAIASLGRFCLQANETNSVYTVPEDEEAHNFHLKYQKECHDKVWADRKSPIASIWNRAHIKVLRLGALVAVGNNPQTPLITLADYLWAKDLVEHGIRVVQVRFERGDVGVLSDGDQQRKIVNACLLNFWHKPYNDKWQHAYSLSKEMHANKVITLRMIHLTVTRHLVFKNSPNCKMALDNCLNMLCEAGTLTKMQLDTTSMNGVRSTVYRINDLAGLA